MIRVSGLKKSYGDLQVLKGIDLSIAQGEIVSIVGASGAGKSTLLHILGTLDKPDEGNVKIREQDLLSLSEKKLAEFRNKHIGFVFQFHHLLPEFTALENICIPAFIAGIPKKEAEKKAEELMRFLNITGKAGNKPTQLSGGEQQRVAVARALINHPDVVLADEPSGNLDSANAGELHSFFFKLRKEFGQTFVIVTHNEEFAAMADRKLTMKDGMMVQ